MPARLSISVSQTYPNRPDTEGRGLTSHSQRAERTMDIGLKNEVSDRRRRERSRHSMLLQRSVAALAIFAAATGIALAQKANPVGTWRVEDGSGNVRIARCGKALCGFADSGGEVFINMKPAGADAWTGVIRDLRDNSNYDGTISIVDAGKLLVHGCVQGGGLCGDQTWTRAR